MALIASTASKVSITCDVCGKGIEHSTIGHFQRMETKKPTTFLIIPIPTPTQPSRNFLESIPSVGIPARARNQGWCEGCAKALAEDLGIEYVAY